MPQIPNFPQNLTDEHHAWHQPGVHPGLPTRIIPQGQPGSGLEFLSFHRTFIAKFHAWYDAQPNADQAAVAPWAAIPSLLKQSALGWNSSRIAEEARINDPLSFASEDALGIFIENGIHGWLHSAAANAFNEPILFTLHSNESTHFYQLHGLVDAWWERYRNTIASRGNTLHLAGATSDGHLWHTIRRADGSWFGFGDVEGETGDRGTIVDVDLQNIGQEVHLCAVNSIGQVWHTIRRADGSWFPFGDVKQQAGDRGNFIKVGIAEVNSELHVCGVTDDGNLWHTIRRLDGSWFGFGDVKEQAGDRGAFTDVDCAGVGPELHVTGTTQNGQLWHTIRRVDGSWFDFGDVEAEAGDRGVLRDVACAGIGGGLHVCSVSEDGRLWHTIRRTDGSWFPFGDVEAEAGDRGSFRTVSVDGVYVP